MRWREQFPVVLIMNVREDGDHGAEIVLRGLESCCATHGNLLGRTVRHL